MRINEKINAIAIDYLSDTCCQSIIRLHEILVHCRNLKVSFGGENIVFLVFIKAVGACGTCEVGEL